MIEVSDLRIHYGSVEAVRGVSFRVPAGQICGYLGPNGAGKSSTVRALVGIQPPTSGELRICGFDLQSQRLEAQRALGYVPDNAAAYSLLTGREYLTLVADLYEIPEAVAAERREELLRRFDLLDVAARAIATFSKGQRQKLVLAAALLHEPRVLILDEPLSGLDALAIRSVKELIRDLAKSGCTILFCSHLLEVVERLCDRVIVLNGGRIVADAPTAELVALSKDQSLESVFLALTEGR
jgi:ABC-2 type transport system ATP-binding protein